MVRHITTRLRLQRRDIIWYIFSALGFYPFNAGSAEYVIGTPLFTKATLHLAGGKDFVINAPNKTPERIYVKKVKLNGETITDYKLTHQQIMSGGCLIPR